MNYSEISSLALSYADRNDSEVTSRIDLFLKIVETRINRELKTKDMSARAEITTVLDQEYYSLPADFAGLRDIEIKETSGAVLRCSMRFMSPEQIDGIAGRNLGGYYYTIVGNELQIMPTQEAGKIIEITYYQKLTPLTSTATTNWLSDDNPDVYIFGLLVEISSFVKDPPTKAIWDERFREALSIIQSDDDKVRWSGTPMQIRSE
jgi:hypothetical protein